MRVLRICRTFVIWSGVTGLATLGLETTGRADVVALYNFDGGANGQAVGSAVDSGPNGLNGTIVGNLRYTTNVAPYSAAGTSALDATADFNFVRVPDAPALHSGGEFTVEAFVNPRYDAFSGGGVALHNIVTKLNTTARGINLDAYSLGFDPTTGKFLSHVGFAGGQGVPLTSADTFTNNTWYHVAETYQHVGTQGILSLYVDGVLEASSTFAYQAPFFGDQPLYIGAGNYAGENGQYRRNFVGDIDSVRISNVALSPDQFLNVAAVPEPSSLALIGVGLFGIQLFRHRRLRRLSNTA